MTVHPMMRNGAPTSGQATEERDVWKQLAAELPKERIAWRQDGRVIQRDGRFIARHVCYVEAGTVRERLDSVVPGEWNLTLEPLPVVTTTDPEGEDNTGVAFKARLQILGVVREDVGQGRDYKAASTDAFKRVAVRFGIGHELYEMDQLWVEMDGDSKYAKPVEDPQAAYERRHQRAEQRATARATVAAASAPAPAQQSAQASASEPRCPFGRTKDTPVSQMETEDLRGAITFAEKNAARKYAAFLEAARAELARREAR